MKKNNLKQWFRPAVLKMKGYVPGEQPKNLSTIKLNTNENPYPPSAVVLKAVRNQADFRLRLYPQPTADSLRQALSKVYHWPLDGILVGNGSDEILSLLFNAALGKGDLVQYPDITYSLYPVLADIREARAREVRLNSDWSLDFKKLSPAARLTLWGYPNPPVGNCFPKSDAKSFCHKVKGLVLIDEAYVDFAKDDCRDIARACANVLILRTMSKSFSLAGVRLGYVLGHPDVIAQLMKVKDSYNVNRMTQAVGLAALSSPGLSDMRQKVGKIRLDRNSLIERLRNLGFSVRDSQANFILATWRGNPDAESLYKNLKKNRVLVRYFSHPRLKDSLRVTIGTPQQNDRLIAELNKLL
ncbi:MAG TPA: histidinol-phosphate transaminase [bacterium]|jgi:histidinol-phosphate aminotransferase|nr:histidinol-phosphate transaminase [bacterium]